MKNEIPNAKLVWKQLEDLVVPCLRLSTIDRAVYAHLLRHSRMEGKQRVRVALMRLAKNIGLTTVPVRNALRRLGGCGAVRVLQRSNAGYVVEVRLPYEISAVRRRVRKTPGAVNGQPLSAVAEASGSSMSAVDIETVDFMRTKRMRKAIHVREGSQCFYCLRKTTATLQCIDHVIPRARAGVNSYRNLVSVCMQCNVQKGEKAVDDFLRRLYRERRLTARELAARHRALEALAAGKLRPRL